MAGRQDVTLCRRLIALRAYAATKQAIEAAESQDQVPDSPMREVWAAVMKERRRESAG